MKKPTNPLKSTIFKNFNLNIILDKNFKLILGHLAEKVEQFKIEKITFELGYNSGNFLNVNSSNNILEVVKDLQKKDCLYVAKIYFQVKLKNELSFKNFILYTNKINLNKGLDFEVINLLLLMNGFIELKEEIK